MFVVLSRLLGTFAPAAFLGACGYTATDVRSIRNTWAIASLDQLLCIRKLLGVPALTDQIAPSLLSNDLYKANVDFDWPTHYTQWRLPEYPLDNFDAATVENSLDWLQSQYVTQKRFGQQQYQQQQELLTPITDFVSRDGQRIYRAYHYPQRTDALTGGIRQIKLDTKPLVDPGDALLLSLKTAAKFNAKLLFWPQVSINYWNLKQTFVHPNTKASGFVHLFKHGWHKNDLLFFDLADDGSKMHAAPKFAVAKFNKAIETLPRNNESHELEYDGVVYASLKQSDYFIVHEWVNNATTPQKMLYVADMSKPENSSTVYFSYGVDTIAFADTMFGRHQENDRENGMMGV